jgi:hypothetical protein
VEVCRSTISIAELSCFPRTYLKVLAKDEANGNKAYVVYPPWKECINNITANMNKSFRHHSEQKGFLSMISPYGEFKLAPSPM